VVRVKLVNGRTLWVKVNRPGFDDCEYEPAEVELPRLTCSPGCLALVDASLAVLLGDGMPGRVERATARRVVACGNRPHHWMARGALVLAHFVDHHGQ
jgi:hypothetical protein